MNFGRMLILALPVLLASCGPADPEAGAFGPAALGLDAIGVDYGDPQAPVTVLEFSDPGCSFCALFGAEIFPEIEREFIATGKVRWKYIPFNMGRFPNAHLAQRALECGAEQGDASARALRAAIYRDQASWMRVEDARPALDEQAAGAGLRPGEFSSCMEASRVRERVRDSNLTAAQMGVRATPTFFIEGTRVEGALPIEHWRRLLEEAR
jgi:protein-disulfide isomerase